MVFVGNRGMVQIHTGALQRVQRIGEWLNILDPGFNLHLQDSRLHETWLVRRPTRDGIITAIEAFDADGHSIVSFFAEPANAAAIRSTCWLAATSWHASHNWRKCPRSAARAR